MVTMHSNGITIEVLESEVPFYKRAGYSVVVVPEPVVDPEPVAPVAPVAPVEKRGKKK